MSRLNWDRVRRENLVIRHGAEPMDDILPAAQQLRQERIEAEKSRREREQRKRRKQPNPRPASQFTPRPSPPNSVWVRCPTCKTWVEESRIKIHHELRHSQ